MTRVLNLRCGSDIGPALKEGGVNGDFLEFSNPFCEGPLFADPASDEGITGRAAWMATRWQMDADALALRLREEADKLHQIKDYAEIRLWFEHDAYDQMILIYLLAFAAPDPDLRSRMSWILINDHAEAKPRFLGLGQLSPDTLAGLVGDFAPVPDLAFDQAAEIWPRLAAGDAMGISQDSALTTALPFFNAALHRLLQDLTAKPLSDQLILQAVADGADTAGRVFRQVLSQLDPCPWYGDAMFLPVIQDLGQGAEALVTPVADWPDAIALTDLGQAVHDGRAVFPVRDNPARLVAGLCRP